MMKTDLNLLLSVICHSQNILAGQFYVLIIYKQLIAKAV